MSAGPQGRKRASHADIDSETDLVLRDTGKPALPAPAETQNCDPERSTLSPTLEDSAHRSFKD